MGWAQLHLPHHNLVVHPLKHVWARRPARFGIRVRRARQMPKATLNTAMTLRIAMMFRSDEIEWARVDRSAFATRVADARSACWLEWTQHSVEANLEQLKAADGLDERRQEKSGRDDTHGLADRRALRKRSCGRNDNQKHRQSAIDPSSPITHRVQISEKTLAPKHFSSLHGTTARLPQADWCLAQDWT